MSKLKSALVAVALAASVVTATGSAAQAASNVTIQKIAGQTIAADARATVRPKVAHASHVVIKSTTITVVQGAKTVANHKKSASLAAGTYRVTTDVSFKTWSVDAQSARQYSSVHHKSKTQTLNIKTKAAKAKKPAADHACTTTASGNCISGGQFCPQAKYGQDGWDGSGRRYVCTGDSTHPHWMTP